jgi:hypothetical protein
MGAVEGGTFLPAGFFAGREQTAGGQERFSVLPCSACGKGDSRAEQKSQYFPGKELAVHNQAIPKKTLL